MELPCQAELELWSGKERITTTLQTPDCQEVRVQQWSSEVLVRELKFPG